MSWDTPACMRAAADRLVFFLTASVTVAVPAGLGGCAPCDSAEVHVDGICVPRCSDDECGEGLACVHSVCRPRCERDSQCKGEDVCERVQTDEGATGRFCYGPAVHPSPYVTEAPADPTSAADAAASAPSGAECRTSAECDQNVLRYCVAERCEVACTLNDHCANAGACTGEGETAEGERVSFCEADAFPRGPGQYGSKCLSATSSCDAALGFRCISAGDGDLGSYCTRSGCDDDAECPSGSYCSETRVTSRQPCDGNCGVPASSASDCIPAEDIGPGKPYRCRPEGGVALTLCLERSFCAPCDNDADCRGEPNQVCARGPDGTKSCTVLCATNQGSCPWGAATECAVFDEELGVPTCGHRFGSCKGTGESCEPCIDDSDCPTGFCAKSDFSGELFCYDASAQCSCEADEEMCTGGGCPLTPSGKVMNCIGTGDGAPPSACYGAEFDTTANTPLGCW